MSNIIELLNITAQEEIYCQYYVNTVDNVFSAYNAGFYNSIKNTKKYDELELKERKSLSNIGNKALKKHNVKARISQLAKIEAQKNRCASLEELLAYLTAIVRKPAEEQFCNVYQVQNSIKAIQILLQRYPNFAGSATDPEEKYIFHRERKKET